MEIEENDMRWPWPIAAGVILVLAFVSWGVVIGIVIGGIAFWRLA